MTLEDTINEKITKAIKEIEEKKAKKKKFKIPFGRKVSKSKASKGYVYLVKLNENSQVDFEVVHIKDQSIMVDKIPRIVSPGTVFYWKKMPMIFMPSWSVEPFSAQKHFEKTLEDGTNKKGFAILMERMQRAAIGEKKPMGNLIKIIIGVGLAAIIGYAFISGGI